MKTVAMGDCRTEGPKPDSRKSELKEGDFLRLKVNFDEDDEAEETAGCLSLFRTRRSHHTDLSMCRSKSTGSVSSGVSPQTKFTEKVLHMFRSSHSDHVVSAKCKPAAPAGSSAGCQHPRRRFIRVVTDKHAPPPDKPNDNPNIIAHYSQDYLQNYYADKRVDGCETVKPYVVSDNSILKKSSTDPTSNRRALSAPDSTIGGAEKHATFNDVVTVFDSFQHTVTEERLHGGADDDEGDESVSDDSIGDETCDGKKVGGFFLDSDSLPAGMTSSKESLQETEIPAKDVTDGACSVEPTASKDRLESQAMQNIFATFTAPPDVLGLEMHDRRPAPVVRQVDLKIRVEQSLASDDGERTE